MRHELTSIAICSGLFVHATVSAVGISLVLLQSAWMFTALKMLGAMYLLWLGVVTIRSARQPLAISEDVAPGGLSRFNVIRSVREGFLSNVLNPKPIVFYMAFLPQFIDPAASALNQSLQLCQLGRF